MKELGSWEGAPASRLRSPVSGTGASYMAALLGCACGDEDLIFLLHFLLFALALRIARIFIVRLESRLLYI